MIAGAAAATVGIVAEDTVPVVEAAVDLAAAKLEGLGEHFALADLKELVRTVVRVGTALLLYGIAEGTGLEDTEQARQQPDGTVLGLVYYNRTQHSDPLMELLPGRSVDNLMAVEMAR
jgi:hypothetical protein